jgi:hypothetical protein
MFPAGMAFGLAVVKSQGWKPPSKGGCSPALAKDPPEEQRGWYVVAFGNADNLDPYVEPKRDDETERDYWNRWGAVRIQWGSSLRGNPDQPMLLSFHDNKTRSRRQVIIPYKAFPLVVSLHGTDIVILGNAKTGQCLVGMLPMKGDWEGRAMENITFIKEGPAESAPPDEHLLTE